jgi:hypothetical protein
MIALPYGGQFSEHDLVDYIRASGRDYIIQEADGGACEPY